MPGSTSICFNQGTEPDVPNYEKTIEAQELSPVKPVLDGEPRYEDHPVGRKKENGYFDDFDTRQAAYWSMLAGACGHTYGNHNIWQFWQPGRESVTDARTPWKEAMDQPGAEQMTYLKTLHGLFPTRLCYPLPIVA